MKKKLLALAMGMTLCVGAIVTTIASADSVTVVSVGADLTDEQKGKMFEYFGTQENEVAVIEVNNDEERAYLEGVATEQQIGRRTYSCAFIEETEEGKGINVKTANLTWVTSNMIKSTLTTAGIYDCNVVAASPFAVSGTGALTGIMKAFEIVTGSPLEETKKEIATEEIVISGNLAEDIGSDEAVGIITDVKDTIIGENIVAADKIEQVIINSGDKFEVTLTDDQVQMILNTMVKVASQDYDYERLASTYSSVIDSAADNIGLELEQAKKGFLEKLGDFFRSIIDWFKNLFTSAKEEIEDNGILDQTDESILGDNVIVDSTTGDANKDESANDDTTSDNSNTENSNTGTTNTETTESDSNGSEATEVEDTDSEVSEPEEIEPETTEPETITPEDTTSGTNQLGPEAFCDEYNIPDGDIKENNSN
ncbi:MAG: DUF1002 domain-containing protein [Clostridiales bacterium]|nr:DUF1002 domain-containing protein [Clostridiales bacterium]